MSIRLREGGCTWINPAWVQPEEHLAFLNCAFRGGWSRREYDWYIGRTFAGARGDLLVRGREARILSAFAILPRQIRVGHDVIDVGIISAAATLPSERGHGHYGGLVRVSVDHARERQYAALLGFVTRDNPSGRALIELGARVIPSFYISSHGLPRIKHPTPAAGLRRTRRCARANVWHRAPEEGRDAQASFCYSNVGDWRSQFLIRPHPVRELPLPQGGAAGIEMVGGTDRLQWLRCREAGAVGNIAKLAALSAASQRSFFMYTLDSNRARAARRLGLKIRDGYLLVLPTGYCTQRWSALATATWHVQSGDRL